MVRTMHLIDHQLCKFVTRVSDLRMSCTLWYVLGFLQSSTDDQISVLQSQIKRLRSALLMDLLSLL